MCDDDKPYVPNEFTVRIPSAEWRMMNMGVEVRDPLLVEREKTHGSFEYNSQVWDAMSKAIPSGFATSNPRKRLAVCMILLKVARLVCSGIDGHKEHFADIAGYAKLGSEACDG